MANYSFGLSGAVPQIPSIPSITSSAGDSTSPMGKALSSAGSFNFAQTPSSTPNFNIATQKPNAVDFSKLSLVQPQQSGVLKSQTVNHPDGSSVVHTYDTSAQSNASTTGATPGLVNPNQKLQENTGNAPQGAPTFPGLLGTIAQQGSQPSPIQNTAQGIAQKSADTYNQLNTQLADSRKNEANAEAQNRLNPIPIGDQTGRESVIRNQYLAQQNALASEAQGATNLFSPALSSATTAQGQQFGAANNAASLAQPSPTAFGQTVFNPAQGNFSGGGGLPPETLAQYAQMAANGQYSAIPSSITSNPVLSAQLNAAAKQINPSYSPVTSTAQGVSAGDLTKQGAEIQAQANGAEQNFNLMLNIAKQGGVNDANVPILNTLQNNVNRGLTSSAAVANFQSLIQSVRSQYASILGGGTVTVEALQEAQSLIPNDISLSALQSLGQNLKSDATNRVTGINQQIQSLSGGGNQSSSGNSGGGGAVVQTSAGPISTDW